MSAQHADGRTCMADFWEQSAKLLQKRAEDDEAVIADLWTVIPPQSPSPEFKAKVEALIERMRATERSEPTHVWTGDEAVPLAGAADRSRCPRCGEDEAGHIAAICALHPEPATERSKEGGG